MRKIEKDMCRAIWRAIGSGGHTYEWRQSNTAVYTAPAYDDIDCDRYWVFVELHGNRIARITCTLGDISRRVEVNNAGWHSPTTKSRINAICDEFGRGRVYQQSHRWFYRSAAGNVFPFPCHDWFNAV